MSDETTNRDPIRGTVTAGDWHIVSYDVRDRDWSRDVLAARADVFGNWWAYSLDWRKQRSGKAVPRDGEEPQAAAMREADNALREMCELPELDAARATIARLNRRAQRAEAIADRCVPDRPVSGPGLGRALANYAASRFAEVAREALDALDRALSAPAHSEEERGEAAELRARLGALTGEGRATLSPMALPTLTEHAAAAYAAAMNSSSAWNALSSTARTAVMARHRFTLDYLAGGEGRAAGTIYEASPGDPPPVQPSP